MLSRKALHGHEVDPRMLGLGALSVHTKRLHAMARSVEGA